MLVSRCCNSSNNADETFCKQLPCRYNTLVLLIRSETCRKKCFLASDIVGVEQVTAKHAMAMITRRCSTSEQTSGLVVLVTSVVLMYLQHSK